MAVSDQKPKVLCCTLESGGMRLAFRKSQLHLLFASKYGPLLASWQAESLVLATL